MNQGGGAVKPVDVLEILWKTLKDNYPMMEYAGVLDDSWLEEYKRKIVEVPDWASAYRLVEELVNRLNDYHTRLEWSGKPILLTPPVKLTVVREGLIVVAEADPSTSLKPGDVVLAVDGMDVMVLFRKLLKRAFGATVYAKRNWVLNQMLMGDPETSVELTVYRHYVGVFNVRIVRMKKLKQENVVSYRMLDAGAGYIRIASFTG